MDVITNYSNLHTFMTTHKFAQIQVQLIPDLSASNFWLGYIQVNFNSMDSSSYQPDYQRDAELEDSTTVNTLAL